MKDPYAALRYPEYRFFLATQFLFTVAIQIQEVVVSFYLYEITGDPLVLGLVGLFVAVPYISVTLFGGYLADKYDKRTIAQICFSVVILCSLILFIGLHKDFGLAQKQHPSLIYACVFLFGFARGFYSPSWSSLKPFLVKPEHYANSATWSTQFWQTGLIVGPAVAGFLYAYLGLSNSLVLVLCLLLFVLIFSSQIKKRKAIAMANTNMIQSLSEGFRFVYKNKILYYAVLLDMLSVLFGGVIAILPVFAKDILAVGAEGLGFLKAAPGLGAVITMLFLAYFNPTNKAWRNMLLAVVGFGLATILFALSINFYLSLFALFLTGAFDSVSVVIRSTILQTLPPDHMRGRVTAVNGIFVSTSNELGAFESGVAARFLGTVTSVVMGGVMTLGVVSYISLKSKNLFGTKLEKVTE
ncbi:Transmembrane secretion effector [Spirosomataceae bacterium TFI 002]|nr:Transmembrane secretion effector [Spirosomataceae bacterium TFI 002]